LELVEKAYIFSAKVHEGQVRLSGESYLSHPLEVAWILTQMKMDQVTIAAGLLHDTLEDTLATPEMIKDRFGPEVLRIVNGVTKINFVPDPGKAAKNFRKMILAMSDVSGILSSWPIGFTICAPWVFSREAAGDRRKPGNLP
jgi:GTP pyrophosphokinase